MSGLVVLTIGKNWSIRNFWESFLIAPAVATVGGRDRATDCAASIIWDRVSNSVLGVIEVAVIDVLVDIPRIRVSENMRWHSLCIILPLSLEPSGFSCSSLTSRYPLLSSLSLGTVY